MDMDEVARINLDMALRVAAKLHELNALLREATATRKLLAHIGVREVHLDNDELAIPIIEVRLKRA